MVFLGAESVGNADKETPLDDSIMKALGESAHTEKEYGLDVHPELVKRVEGIITQGLKQDFKKELLKKYLIPANSKLLDAPKLNRELEGLLNDTMKARDKRVEERQQQMGVAIAALLSATDSLIKEDVDKIKLISTLSDVVRLLMDLHHQDTITRKKLIVPNLDKNIAKTVENQKRDVFLFGEKFNENVKTATAIKKSAGTILKQTTPNRKPIPNRPNYTQNQYKRQGNYRGPPRTSMTQFKQGGGGRYYQQPQPQYHPQRPKPPPRAPAKPPVRQT